MREKKVSEDPQLRFRSVEDDSKIERGLYAAPAGAGAGAPGSESTVDDQ